MSDKLIRKVVNRMVRYVPCPGEKAHGDRIAHMVGVEFTNTDGIFDECMTANDARKCVRRLRRAFRQELWKLLRQIKKQSSRGS